MEKTKDPAIEENKEKPMADIKEKHMENTEDKKFNEKSAEKQAIVLIASMVVIILIIAGIFLFMRGLNNFDYHGIKFAKTTQGEIVFYTAKIPLTNTITGKIVSYTTQDFRNDPRKLKSIPINVSQIKFRAQNTTYISYSDSLKICEDNGLAAANLGVFLSDAGLKVKGAMNNESYENSTSLPYVNCERNPDNTVILVEPGNETKIQQTSNNCYEIITNDCDILKATERFELAILEQYSGY